MIDLKIQGNPIGVTQTLGQLVQPLGIRTALITNRIILIHPVDILLDILRHLLVGQSNGLDRLGGTAYRLFQVELR